MGSFKPFALGAVAAAALSTAAFAADPRSAGILTAPPVVTAAEAPVAVADTGGWYLRGDIGVGINSIGRFNALTGGVVQPVAPATWELRDKSISDSFFAGLGIGYSFNSWLRADVTAEYRAGATLRGMDYATFTPTPPLVGATGPSQLTNTYSGDVKSLVGLVNLYADLGTFCAFGCLTPFVGAGVGVAATTVSGFRDQGAGFTPGVGPFIPLGAYASQTSRTNFAWALMAGLGYKVNERISMELGYRYLNMGHLPDLTLRDAGTGAATANVIRVRELTSHEIRLGMRWMLSSDCCGAPAVAAPVIARN